MMNFLAIGCVLSVFFILGGAIVNDFPDGVKNALGQIAPGYTGLRFGTGQEKGRVKREISMKNLSDPDGCIEQCRDKEIEGMTNAATENAQRIIFMTMEEIEELGLDLLESEDEYIEKLDKKMMPNISPYFDDLCNVSKEADNCFEKCPSSQLRSIMMIMNNDVTNVMCEPGHYWDNFTEFFYALNCTNTTHLHNIDMCESKCGPQMDMSNVTGLQVDLLIGNVQVEDNVKSNTRVIGQTCKSIYCTIRCYESIMKTTCGEKAAEMYARMAKMEPRSSLNILTAMEAIEPNEKCEVFQ